MKNKCAILLSTYNGQDYIKSQLISIQRQTFKDWNLYIRDDGSTDATLKIISNFQKKDKRIHILNDGFSRLRPKKSFLKLLSDVEADFYFFCDQDDYWLKDKLGSMLHTAYREKAEKPLVVYCGLKCVDQSLANINNSFEHMIGQMSKLDDLDRFIGNDAPGCVMLINNALKELALQNLKNIADISMHDWWLILVAQIFGKVIFINKKLVLYRQHGNNAIGAGKNGNDFQKLFQKDIFSKQKDLVRQSYWQSFAFLKNYKNNLSKSYQTFLKEMINCRFYSPIKRYIFLKKYNLREYNYVRTLAYRLTFSFYLDKCIRNQK